MKENLWKLTAAALAIISLVIFYASAFFIPVPAGTASTAACAGAAVIILANALLLYFTYLHISLHSSIIIPALYILIVSVNPQALYWTVYHPASMCLLVSVMLHLAYCAAGASTEYLVGSLSMLCIAGLIMPQLFWLTPLYLLSSIGKAEEKSKFIVTSILALTLPVIVYAGIRMIVLKDSFDITHFSYIWEGMSDVRIQNFHLTAATLSRFAMFVIAIVTAFVFTVRNLGRYRTIQFLAYARILVLTLAVALISILFKGDGCIPYELFLAIPAALLTGEYFKSSDKRRSKAALAAASLLILIAERISLFL